MECHSFEKGDYALIRKSSLAAVIVLVATTVTHAQNDPYVAYLEGVEADSIRDGDTPLIQIRMFGIDTPEKEQMCERPNGSCYPCGQRATWVLSGLLVGEATYRFTGESTYGRPVATIFMGQKDINLEMVRLGHAVVYERYLAQEMLDRYLEVQREAKDAERGVWQGNFIQPEEWRNGKRLACE